MFRFDLEDYASSKPCIGWENKSREDLITLGGYVFQENNDGTVTIINSQGNVGLGNASGDLFLNYSRQQYCCEQSGYIFDVENSQCLWSTPTESFDDPFKIIINPNLDNSVLFDVDENETCCLDISFDYLFKFDCHVLEEAINGETIAVNKHSNKIIKQQDEIDGKKRLIAKHKQAIDDLNDVPYVIECTQTTNPWQDFSGDYGWKRPTNLDFDRLYKGRTTSWRDGLNDNTTPISAEDVSNNLRSQQNNTFNSSDYTPPQAYAIPGYGITKKYCLTDEGLQAWSAILGGSYNAWLSASGADTSMYNCDEISKFEQQAANSSSPYYIAKCYYTINDKRQAQDSIRKHEEAISKLNEDINIINLQILSLRTQTERIETEGSCNSIVDFFESLEVYFQLEKFDTTTNKLVKVYTKPIFSIGSGGFGEYISTSSGATGIMISGATGLMPTLNQGDSSPTPPFSYGYYDSEIETPSDCLDFRQKSIREAVDALQATEVGTAALELADRKDKALREGTSKEEIENINGNYNINELISNWWQSCWLTYSQRICDEKIIEMISNESINMSLIVNSACADFSILLDRIKLKKDCTKVDNVETFISEPPKFEITKIVDNKKSWLANKSRDSRFYELKYRPAEYNTNHHKLVINTKEVDLNLSPARAVEQDVWCYMQDNNILNCDGTGITTCDKFEFYSEPASCDYPFSATTGIDNITFGFIGSYDLGIYCDTVPTKDILETYGCYGCEYEEDRASNYRFARDASVKKQGEYNAMLSSGYGDDSWQILYPTAEPINTYIDALKGDTEEFGIWSIGNLRENKWIYYYASSAYTFEYNYVDGDGNSLNSIFSGNSLFYKSAVPNLQTLTGITGNPGDLRNVGPVNSNTMYFYDPRTSSWWEDGYDRTTTAPFGPSVNQTASFTYNTNLFSYTANTTTGVITSISSSNDPLLQSVWDNNSYTNIGSELSFLTGATIGQSGSTSIKYVFNTTYSGLSTNFKIITTGSTGVGIVNGTVTGSTIHYSGTANNADNLIEDLWTIKRMTRDARLKSYNEMALAIRPFLWSNKYLPAYQVKKYILK